MNAPTPIDDPISTRELAQHLRRMMELTGYNDAMLAARIGVQVRTVEAWLYGHNLEKVATILGAFEAMGCTVKILPPRR